MTFLFAQKKKKTVAPPARTDKRTKSGRTDRMVKMAKSGRTDKMVRMTESAYDADLAILTILSMRAVLLS